MTNPSKVIPFRRLPKPLKRVAVVVPPGATREERKRAIFDAMNMLGDIEAKPPAPSIHRFRSERDP